MKTAKLIGVALDWAVAKCEGDTSCVQFSPLASSKHYFAPSKKWPQGGPIIDREKLAVWFHTDYACWCAATIEWTDADVESDVFLEMPDAFRGETPLIAAMRCYVASKLGDEVKIPDELIKETND
jgi:hypothetical protein